VRLTQQNEEQNITLLTLKKTVKKKRRGILL